MSISVFSLLQSIILARALFVAANLNIAEHLATKPMSVSEIAAITNVDAPSLQRLLYFLELNEIFKKNDENYYLTEFSQLMCGNNQNTIKPFLLHDDETRWNSYGNLGYSIKTGKASFDHLYGISYFDYLKNNPILSSRFNEAMTIISAQEDEVIAKTIHFTNIVADIGGGTGQLINQIANNNNIDKSILFDLPEAIDQANNLPIHCSKVSGSFFEPIAFTADIFILKRILHDWDDEKALNILKNISGAMTRSSKLYIIDGILDYSKDKAVLAAIDLALLAVFQGKERTKLEFKTLIKAAGLEIVSIQTLDNIICAIECKKG